MARKRKAGGSFEKRDRAADRRKGVKETSARDTRLDAKGRGKK